MKHSWIAASVISAALAAACAGGEVDVPGASSTTPSGGGGGGGSGAGAGVGGAAGGTVDAGSGAAGKAGANDDGGAPSDDAGDATFIAFSDDFADFQTWTSFYLGEVPPTINEIAGPRTIYVNKLPPKGSKTFPVGTMIVKAIQVGAPTEWQIFAMAKRGGGFNEMGAAGWEWFELSLKLGPVNVVWRGSAPPSGMGYGPGIGGVCNDCHGAAKTNDYVQSPPLMLTAF
jgi:hypothetical protein